MERETKEIKIGDYTFQVKTYASAREVNEIQGVYLKGSSLEVVGDQPKISDISPNIKFDMEKEMINQMVISVNNTTENIVDTIIDLPNNVYEELIGILDALVSKKV